MPPKKKIMKEFEEGEAVDTQELAEAIMEPAAPSGSLVAYADFEITVNYVTKSYKAGDVFTAPEGWKRDELFEEFRNMDRARGEATGMPFSIPVPVLDEKNKVKYWDSRRVVLPLKEA